MSAQSHPQGEFIAVRRLAGLPEPLQPVLVDLVDAVAGLGQAEKATSVEALSSMARQAPEAALALPLHHLALVIDELHTLSAPAEARPALRRSKRSARQATDPTVSAPRLLHGVPAGLRIPQPRPEGTR